MDEKLSSIDRGTNLDFLQDRSYLQSGLHDEDSIQAFQYLPNSDRLQQTRDEFPMDFPLLCQRLSGTWRPELRANLPSLAQTLGDSDMSIADAFQSRYGLGFSEDLPTLEVYLNEDRKAFRYEVIRTAVASFEVIARGLETYQKEVESAYLSNEPSKHLAWMKSQNPISDLIRTLALLSPFDKKLRPLYSDHHRLVALCALSIQTEDELKGRLAALHSISLVLMDQLGEKLEGFLWSMHGYLNFEQILESSPENRNPSELWSKIVQGLATEDFEERMQELIRIVLSHIKHAQDLIVLNSKFDSHSNQFTESILRDLAYSAMRSHLEQACIEQDSNFYDLLTLLDITIKELFPMSGSEFWGTVGFGLMVATMVLSGVGIAGLTIEVVMGVTQAFADIVEITNMYIEADEGTRLNYAAVVSESYRLVPNIPDPTMNTIFAAINIGFLAAHLPGQLTEVFRDAKVVQYNKKVDEVVRQKNASYSMSRSENGTKLLDADKYKLLNTAELRWSEKVVAEEAREALEGIKSFSKSDIDEMVKELARLRDNLKSNKTALQTLEARRVDESLSPMLNLREKKLDSTMLKSQQDNVNEARREYVNAKNALNDAKTPATKLKNEQRLKGARDNVLNAQEGYLIQEGAAIKSQQKISLERLKTLKNEAKKVMRFRQIMGELSEITVALETGGILPRQKNFPALDVFKTNFLRPSKNIQVKAVSGFGDINIRAADLTQRVTLPLATAVSKLLNKHDKALVSASQKGLQGVVADLSEDWLFGRVLTVIKIKVYTKSAQTLPDVQNAIEAVFKTEIRSAVLSRIRSSDVPDKYIELFKTKKMSEIEQVNYLVKEVEPRMERMFELDFQSFEDILKKADQTCAEIDSLIFQATQKAVSVDRALPQEQNQSVW